MITVTHFQPQLPLLFAKLTVTQFLIKVYPSILNIISFNEVINFLEFFFLERRNAIVWW